jgi:TetR/AcrR family transcriptional regulator, transcriptional repressor for nem operon
MSASTIHENILDVAEGMIQTQGYNAFSFRDIAQVIGIKTSSIHYYFPTKEDLGKAVVSRYINALHTELENILQNTTINYKNKIRLFLQSIIEKTYASNRKMCLGGMLASDVLTLPPGIQAEVRNFFTRIEKWLEQLLLQGKQHGEFHYQKTAKREAQYILCLLEGSLLMARLFHDEKRLQMASKQIEAHLF